MGSDAASFYTDLMQEVAARASARGELTRTVLVEDLVQRLVDGDELQDWVPCYYDGRGARGRTIGVDGYSTDELGLDGTLHIIVADLRAGTAPEALATADVNAAFSRARGFVTDALAGRLHESLEPSTPAADLARFIHQQQAAIKTVRVLLLSNATLGVRYREVDREAIKGVKLELQAWDLARFEQLSAAGGHEVVEIDLAELVEGGLPALPAGIGETAYAAYLCVVPGRVLAELYERYGSRLLEGNVRAFLGTRAKVNTGIRKTIKNYPERFFAFNNGIAATATDAELVTGEGGPRLVRVRDLQIVNGGQTTASLYNAWVRERLPLDLVFVQMKLSVLAPDVAQAMIPDISRFANTQTQVKDADLFANHPFHRKVEELSRRLWAPPRPGSHQMTHWFYERARAQFQTAQFTLSAAAKREFLIQNPKDQLITKTDLAKFENTWRMRPHDVSFGAQKNFARYAATVREEYDRRPDDFNERWFQHIVAKAIVFKAAERLVSGAAWYSGGYRANIVTYGVARLVRLVEQQFPGRVLDLDRVWRSQRLSDALSAQVLLAAEAASRELVSERRTKEDVTEWAKLELCWQAVADAPIQVVDGLEDDLKAVDDEQGERRGARAQDREDSTINAQMDVVGRGQTGYWRRAMAYPAARRLLSEVDFGIVVTAATARSSWVPSDAQARRLLAAARKLDEDGLT
jgi:hypothetical protein